MKKCPSIDTWITVYNCVLINHCMLFLVFISNKLTIFKLRNEKRYILQYQSNKISLFEMVLNCIII